MTFVDKDLNKVFMIQTDINCLKLNYSFINRILFISDSGTVGIRIYHPRMVHILHNSLLKYVLKGFRWEGEYTDFKRDLEKIDTLLNIYSNIELILPVAPSHAMVKYLGEEYAQYKNLYNYSHEDYSYRDKSLVEKIKYYLIKIIKKYFFCYKSEEYFYI